MDSTEKVWGHQQKEFVILFIMLIVTSLIKLQLSLSRILNSTFLEKKIWPVSYGQKTKSCNRGMDAQSPCLWEALLLFSRQVVSDSCYPTDCSPQAPVSMVFSRQEYWNGFPFPSPGDLPNPGVKPVSPILYAVSLPLSHLGSPYGQCRQGKVVG